MNILQQHIVPEGTPRQRLSDYAPEVFEDHIPSRKGIKKAIKRGALLINGKVGHTGDWVVGRQQLTLLEMASTHKILELPLEVVLEDDHLAVINKPGGIPVSGNQFRTIQNALPFNLQPSDQKDRLLLPRPVHRLDSPTCGLLMVAKTSRAAMDLGRQLKERAVKKRYQAVVMGKMDEKGCFKQPIEGKPAATHYELLEQYRSIKNDWLSLVDLFPETGRTHQLRIHLSTAGHPILGDAKYGIKGKVKKGKGLFLCATGLAFRHPVLLEERQLIIEPPAKFLTTLIREERMWKKRYPFMFL